MIRTGERTRLIYADGMFAAERRVLLMDSLAMSMLSL